MEISERYKLMGAEYAAIKAYSHQYRMKGYKVFEYYKLGNTELDLYMEKGDTKIAFEFRTRKGLNSPLINKKRKFVEEHNINFKVVLVQVPIEKTINVSGIENTLEEEFSNNIPDDLDSLASHIENIEVDDIEITKLSLESNDNVEILGLATVLVDLYYDSETIIPDSFPFTFSGIWSIKDKLKLKELTELNIDTSSFYK